MFFHYRHRTRCDIHSTRDGDGPVKCHSKQKDSKQTHRDRQRIGNAGIETTTDPTDSGSESESTYYCCNEVALDRTEVFSSDFSSASESEPFRNPSAGPTKAKYHAMPVIREASLAHRTRGSNEIVQEHEESGFVHYFWGSRFFTSIYVIIVVAGLSREPYILYGIPIIVLWFIQRRTVAWGAYLVNIGGTKAAVRHLQWIKRFAFKQVKGTIEGDSLLALVAMARALSFLTDGYGKGLVLHYYQNQGHEIRQRLLKQAADVLVVNKRRFQQGDVVESPTH